MTKDIKVEYTCEHCKETMELTFCEVEKLKQGDQMIHNCLKSDKDEKIS